MAHTLRAATTAIRANHGVSLVEAMVALLVMSLGMLALAGVQSTLRTNGDISRQRAEAARIASEEIEQLRLFATINPVAGETNPSWSALAARTVSGYTLPGSTNNVTYDINRKLTVTAGRHLVAQVDVTWVDQTNATRTVVLDTVVAGIEPILSSMVAQPAPALAFSRRSGRHASIPEGAKDVGDYSGFKPRESGGTVWWFNNLNGTVTTVCTGVSTATTDLTGSDRSGSGCETLSVPGQLVSGAVRFNFRNALASLGGGQSVYKPSGTAGRVAWVFNDASPRVQQVCAGGALAGVATSALTTAILSAAGVTCTSPPSALTIAPYSGGSTLLAADSENPHWPALNLTVSMPTGDNVSRLAECLVADDTPATSSQAAAVDHVSYFCLVRASDTTGWGGRLDLTPLAYRDDIVWPLSQYKVCRYTTDIASSTRDDPDPLGQYTANVNHPYSYCRVTSIGATPSSCLVANRVKGNLINQNFLVIDAGQACPTDSPVNAASGNLVNSNSQPHQPLSR